MKRKKNLVLILLIEFFLLGIVSCKNDKNIIGEWINNSLQKTELLNDQGRLDSLFAYIFVQKSVKYIFDEKGNFKKIVSQRIQNIEYLDENPEQKFSVNSDGSSYELEGTYFTRNGALHLTVNSARIKIDKEEIILKDAEIETQDILLETRNEVLPYEITDTGLTLWDIQLMDYLRYEKTL